MIFSPSPVHHIVSPSHVHHLSFCSSSSGFGGEKSRLGVKKRREKLCEKVGDKFRGSSCTQKTNNETCYCFHAFFHLLCRCWWTDICAHRVVGKACKATCIYVYICCSIHLYLQKPNALNLNLPGLLGLCVLGQPCLAGPVCREAETFTSKCI